MEAELAEKPELFQFAWGKAALMRVWRGIVAGLTPARCLSCGDSVQESAAVCATCFAKLKLIDEPVCDVMGTAFAYDQGEGAKSPQALSHPPPWDRARAAVEFDEHSKVFVHAFKYGDKDEAGLFMARMMGRAGAKLVADADMIVPVPLHWTRLWKRRFNQAAYLAQKLAHGCGKTYAPHILKRIRATPQQVGLDAEARKRNMRKAFAVAHAERIQSKTVVLVDDVRTTGATISACVEALKQAGAARVFVLTFALVNNPFRPHTQDHDVRDHDLYN